MDGALKNTNSTYYVAILEYLSIYTMLFNFAKLRELDTNNNVKIIYQTWLGVNLFSLIRGLIISDTYWDLKFLFLQGVGFSLIPVFFIIGNQIEYFKFIIDFTFNRIFLYGFVLIPITFLTTTLELYSRIMIPSVYLVSLVSYVNLQRRFLLFLVITLSIFLVLDFRSLQLKVAFSLFLFLLFALRFDRKFILLVVHRAIFLVPFIFMILATQYDYNVFVDGLNQNESRELTITINDTEKDLLTDTRTFIYLETIASLEDFTEWIFGKSIIGTYKTDSFGNDGGVIEGRRYGSEVGLLNILLKYGILGVMIFGGLLFIATDLAIKESRNHLSRFLALIIAFKWPMMFVEEFTEYDLNFAFFWLIMGFITNRKVLGYSDNEIYTVINVKRRFESLKIE